MRSGQGATADGVAVAVDHGSRSGIVKSGESLVVVGGGTMGRDIAAIFHAAGWRVQVVETDASARTTLAKRVRDSARAIGAAKAPGSIEVVADLGAADWPEVGLVIEAVPERLPVKREVFAALERLAPAEAPLASNSSSFPISEIGAGLATQSRMLGLHFFMPAHLVPAVEVVRGGRTGEAVAQAVTAIMRSVGRKPVQVARDIPGFLGNRLQHALMREAIALVEQGFASPEDVDTVVRYGFGFRYIAAGPLLQKDHSGIDIHCAAAATMYPHLANTAEPSPLLRQLVERGEVGMKAPSRKGFYRWDEASIARETARYQRALAAALRILRDEDAEV
jgi:3-hydroxybutyryl-CoA dehydrogenase